MKNNNTIAAYHIISNENGTLKLNTNQTYHWNIPKRLREDPIQKGDIGCFCPNPRKGLIQNFFTPYPACQNDFKHFDMFHNNVCRAFEMEKWKKTHHFKKLYLLKNTFE